MNEKFKFFLIGAGIMAIIPIIFASLKIIKTALLN